MKKLSLIIVCLLFVGCGKETVFVPQQEPSINPSPSPQPTPLPNKDDHSFVTNMVVLPKKDPVCKEGGKRLDIYLDIDDSLTYTAGDTYLNSLTLCK